MLSHTSEDLPPKEQEKPSKVGWTSGPNPLEKEVTRLTPRSPQLELEVSILEPDILEKVDLLGCTDWDPKDQWEAQSILKEYADVFAMVDLDLGQTSIMKHKITLEEWARPIKEHYRRVPPGLYDQVWRHLQEMIYIRAIQLSNSPWASAVVLVRKRMANFVLALTCRS